MRIRSGDAGFVFDAAGRHSFAAQEHGAGPQEARCFTMPRLKIFISQQKS